MLDPTLQEKLLKLSIRTYFVDNIETALGKLVFFDRTYFIPKVANVEATEWIMFHFGKIDIDILSRCMLQIYCFARKDADGELLSGLVDLVKETLFDHDATDGLKKIPYLDGNGNVVTGIVPIVQTILEEDMGADGTKFKIISVRLNWGTK